MAAVLSTTLIARNLPVSYSVSTGNEAASGVEDYVGWLIDDPDTQVIAMIVEQFRKPARFLELARAAHAAARQSCCCIRAKALLRVYPQRPTPVPWLAIIS